MATNNLNGLSRFRDTVHRHRLGACCAFLVGIALTLFAVKAIPQLYEADTLLMLQPPQASTTAASAGDSRLQRSDSLVLEDRLKSLQPKVLNHTVLGDVIEQYNLYPRELRSNSRADIIGHMIGQIDVELSDPPKGKTAKTPPDTFQLSFVYSDPALAQRTVARLAELFGQENQREDLAQAAAAVKFLDVQVARSNERLQVKEAEIRDFKRLYRGSLPEDVALNERTESTLEGRLASAQTALNALEDSNGGGRVDNSPEATLAAMKTKLAVLQAQYSDAYPDVIQLKAQIAALESSLNKPPMATTVAEADNSDDSVDDSQPMDDAQRLRNQIATLQGAINSYQKRIMLSTDRAAQLATLTRDYSVMVAEYHGLLDRRLQAQMDENLARSGSGTRLAVIVPAHISSHPVPPDHLTVGLVGLVTSVAVMLALPFGLALTENSHEDPDDLSRECQVPVLAVIPKIRALEGAGPKMAGGFRALIISLACFAAGAAGIWLYARTVF
jgi:uncharacterized protein involved in exopolysaccharide biosynthesis